MGLDYSYVLLVEQLDEPKLLDYLAQVGKVEELSQNLGVCVLIDFLLDETVLDYQNKAVAHYAGSSWTGNNRNNYRNFFPTDAKARIGCIYLDIKRVPANNRCYVCFTAATSSMSRLLQVSSSIKSWFVHLGNLLGDTAVFLDQEAEGYLLIRKQGRDLSITLPEDLATIQVQDADQQEAAAICRGYYELL